MHVVDSTMPFEAWQCTKKLTNSRLCLTLKIGWSLALVHQHFLSRCTTEQIRKVVGALSIERDYSNSCVAKRNYDANNAKGSVPR